MQQWEYHQEPVPLKNLKETCQKAGADGWELASSVPMLVATSPLAGAEPMPGALLIFKRPLMAKAGTVNGQDVSQLGD